MHRRTLVLAVLLAASSARAQPMESVVAFVDDEPILASELRERLDEAGGVADGRDLRQRASEMLDRMIDDFLIARVAHQLHVVVTGDEVSRAMVAVRAQNGMDEATFLAALRAQGFTWTTYEEGVERQLLRLKVLQLSAAPVQVSGEELRRLYDERVADVPPEQRQSFDQARDALYRELASPRITRAQEEAMRAMRDAAYIERRLEP